MQESIEIELSSQHKVLQTHTADQPSAKYSRWEYILPALAIGSLVASCVMVSSKKYFWNDELYSYYFTSDPSLWKMLVAFHDKINNTPLLYFLLGWLWDKLFTSSELSLRLFSSLGMCVALISVWLTLRRTYHFWATSIGTLGIFCTSQIILSQNAEARMYGLFLGLSAIALLVYERLNRSIQPSSRLLAVNTCLHIGIVHTHLFGGFYSGAVLMALLLTDKCFKLWRPKVYLSVVLSWVSVLFYIPSFLNQSDAGRPRTWIPAPVFRDLVDFFTSNALYKPSILLIVLLIPVLQTIIYKAITSYTLHTDKPESKVSKKPFDTKAELSLLIFAAAFILVPVFVWLVSVSIKPMFWDRYMIPSALGFAIFLTYVTSRFVDLPALSHGHQMTQLKIKNTHITLSYIGLLTIMASLIIYPVFNSSQQYAGIPPGRFDNVYGYDDLPVVVQGSDSFLQRLHYSDKAERYHYILDWPSALSHKSGLFGPQEYKHLEALKRNYPLLFQNVVNSQQFLNKHDKFLVLDYYDYQKDCPLNVKGIKSGWDNIHCPQWVETRLLHNANYKVSCLGSVPTYFTLLLVEKQK